MKSAIPKKLDKYAVVLVVVATHDTRLKTLASHVSAIEIAILDAPSDEKVKLVDLRK